MLATRLIDPQRHVSALGNPHTYLRFIASILSFMVLLGIGLITGASRNCAHRQNRTLTLGRNDDF